MHVTAIIAAAGAGSRLAAGVPKQLLELGGRTILQRSYDAFASHPRVNDVIVVLPAELTSDPPLSRRDGASMIAVSGGGRRQDSVANAFQHVASGTDIVLVHDAARPFVSEDTISRVIDAAALYGAAIVAQPVRDTVKRVRVDGSSLQILETLPRESIFLAQTPQAFKRAVLQAAVELGQSGVEATDEAALAERAGHVVHVVEGDGGNIKITTPEDLAIARDRMASEPTRANVGRIGTGYDLHRLVEGRPLVIGGVDIPSPLGALGHSDADVVCHAATDAVLGAACLGDIGGHFPDTDPRWKDASSIELLRHAASLLGASGYRVMNLDVVVILERPKISPFVDRIRGRLAEVLGTDIDRISVKGKTNEGMDAIGRGEAIAAHAVALLTAAS